MLSGCSFKHVDQNLLELSRGGSYFINSAIKYVFVAILKKIVNMMVYKVTTIVKTTVNTMILYFLLHKMKNGFHDNTKCKKMNSSNMYYNQGVDDRRSFDWES